ncbi:hypothetical protein, partial [Rhodoferax sp.]|uniref:hypothetical protein n=1 Tax=Rhodoferax sp. TaxID=50421 RepID=UPI0025F0BA7B
TSTQSQQGKNTERRRIKCRLIHNRVAKNTFKPCGSKFDCKLAQIDAGINNLRFGQYFTEQLRLNPTCM